MRTLPSALTEAQKRAPLEWPKVRIRIRKHIGGVRRLDFERVYTGEETDGFHCATMPSDGSLNRFRVDPADSKLYRERVADPINAPDGGTFGNDNESASHANIPPDWKVTSKFTLSATITIEEVKAYCRAVGAPCKAKALIYADDAGAPAELLATSQEVTGIDTALEWRTFTFASPVNLSPGTYWLGLHIGDNSLYFYRDAGDENQGAVSADAYADGPTDPFGTPAGYYAYAFNIYATYPGFGSWTDTTETAGAIACDSYAANVILAFIDNSSPYHVWMMESSDSGASWGAAADTGAVSDANGRVAVALKSDGTICILYTRGTNVYARKKPNGGWSSEFSSAYGLTSISGLAMAYEGDWNFLVTGVNSSSQDGIWSAIFGDGYGQAPETFSPLYDLMLRESTEPFQYTAPFLAYPDVYRTFFVEKHTDPTTQNRVYFSFMGTTADYQNQLWREPIPFDLETLYGIAIAYSSQDVWLCTPYGVWKASLASEYWDITDDVIEIFETDAPHRYRSKLKVILDNTAGKYNNFDKLGYEITFGKGYLTSQGPLYSEGSAFQIVNWRFVSPSWFPLRMIYPRGVLGTLEIHCEGFWDLAKRYKFRREFSWAAGEKNATQILMWLIARLGFEIYSAGASATLSNLSPPLTIRAGTKAYTVIRKILSWSPDVLFQRASRIYIKELDPEEAVDYDYNSTYGISHIVFRGNYGIGAWDPNRAQVWSDTFMVEGFEFPQIQQVYDRLAVRTTPEYPNVARAGDRVDAELRKGEVFAANPGWVQITTNCGQEPFDIITISDVAAGVVAIKRRVLGIRTHWLTPFLYQQVFEVGAP